MMIEPSETQKMVGKADLMSQQRLSVLDVQYLLDVSSKPVENQFLNDVASTAPSPIFGELCSSDSVSCEASRSESVVNYSSSIQTTVVQSSVRSFIPANRSGSHTDKGCRESNEDEYICIDDLSAHLGYVFGCTMPSAFYAVFDGHGGSNAAAAFLKEKALQLFFGDAILPQTSGIISDAFLEELENSHRKAFLLADEALARECSVPTTCGTTALTALVLGRHLMIANAGDCRAVLCRKGVAVQMSHDHRTCDSLECKRVEESGGFILCGYLGDLSVTRSLGDWYMKCPVGSVSPLTAEPEVGQIMLTEDDEFLIVACDGIWDVMSNEIAVSLVRRALRRHDDPQQCARELVNEALRLNATDNLTAIVVCFTSVCPVSNPRGPGLGCFGLSEEGRNRLRGLLEGNPI
ncbi:probable protein phosphatase 2C 13 [Diospyros lotus]|uniref:probable protein phosphatase 2C 13 n=1 Tax=Diospyros lotus TaxID=55363 RepID=UPI002250512C|nr:probable protein phosphatase 2C 13 [Diospyros lotus]